jgi:hypothetical protein
MKQGTENGAAARLLIGLALVSATGGAMAQTVTTAADASGTEAPGLQ